MGLYKKGKSWYIDYYYPPGRAGKRIREKVGPLKDEARILLAKRLEDIRHGRNPELRKVSPALFSDHARKCLTEHYSKKRSEPWARLVVERHLLPCFGDRVLGEITPQLVSEYMTRRLADGVCNSTVNNERGVLSKIMNLALDWDLLHANPVGRVKKLIWNDLSTIGYALSPNHIPLNAGADQVTVEVASSTVDHSDIRGSSPEARRHGRDPSGAASD
jgi:hypothetical protein